MNDSQGKDKPRGQRPAGGRPAARTGGAPHSGARPARGGKPDEQRLWTKGGAPARGDKDAREQVIAMCKQAGIQAFDAGVLANAVVVETLTAVLIAINVKYKVKGAGIRLTSVPRD